MQRVMLLLALVSALLLAGCSRVGAAATPTPGLEPVGEFPPTPTLSPLDPSAVPPVTGFETPVPLPGETPIVPEVQPEATTDPMAGGRFTELRFATSGNGVAQANFPEGTQEIYAIWNYDGMQATDTMDRVWYLNDTVYVERNATWDFLKYGFSGTVRDVFLYDYIDGIDVGSWKVELYLNGELQLTGTFTVGGP